MVLILFSIILVVCVILHISMTWALLLGYALFFAYSRKKGFSTRQIIGMSLEGLATAKDIVIMMLMIGVMTALWRGSGTIAAVVYYAMPLMRPSVMLLSVFLLNGLTSTLTGSSFATAATMGVISMTLASASGCSMFLAGGAFLSGIYLGDRCSPVSTSAQLCANLTGTDIYHNITLMVKSAVVPFIVSCLVFLLAGRTSHSAAEGDIRSIFLSEFHISLIVLLPAILIIVMAIFRVPIRELMGVSILAAALICVLVQHMPLQTLLRTALTGYRAETPELSEMMNGGGIVSMVSVALIVAISSTYSGIFKHVGILDDVQARLEQFHNPRWAMLIISLAASVVSCNQTLAIMLTHQLCENLPMKADDKLLGLENTAAVIAPLIPWSIAGSIPLATVGAPIASMAFGCYLYLLPIWWLVSRRQTSENQSVELTAQKQ